MTQNRRDALAGLATILAQVTGVTTVVRSYQDVDITQYTIAQLPLINVKEPDESTDEEYTSQHSMKSLAVSARVYFVSWAEVPTSNYENLTKAIRDKIGANFGLAQCASKLTVAEISTLQGEMPLYFFEIKLSMLYYMSELAT